MLPENELTNTGEIDIAKRKKRRIIFQILISFLIVVFLITALIALPSLFSKRTRQTEQAVLSVDSSFSPQDSNSSKSIPLLKIRDHTFFASALDVNGILNLHGGLQIDGNTIDIAHLTKLADLPIEKMQNGSFMTAQSNDVLSTANTQNQLLAEDATKIIQKITSLLAFPMGNVNGYVLRSNGSDNPPSWQNPNDFISHKIAFNDILTGLNTTAEMIVGNGASLSSTGTGSIAATLLLGKTWAVPDPIGVITPSSGAFSSMTILGETKFPLLGAGMLQVNTTGVLSSAPLSVSNENLNGVIAIAHGGTGAGSAEEALINLGLDAGGTGDIWVHRNGDTMTGRLNVASGGLMVNGTTDPHLLYIDPNTNRVGIGDPDPAEKLHVIGNIKLENAIPGTKSYRLRTTGGALDLESAGEDLYFSAWELTNYTGLQRNKIVLEAYANNIQLINNVQFRPMPHGDIYHEINGNGGATFNAIGGNNDFRAKGAHDPNLLFIVASTDKVGIGTSSPEEKLHVANGNMRIGGGSLCVNSTDTACSGNTAGTLYASNTTVQSADVAENYISSQQLEPGDIVMPSGSADNAIGKTTQQYQSSVIGIVSTKPGVTLNSDAKVDALHPYRYPIALSGRVPVKVSNENGSISVGDLLTTSSTPGVAMRATQNETSIGKALESYNAAGVGKIMIFVTLTSILPVNDNLAKTDNGLLQEKIKELTSLFDRVANLEKHEEKKSTQSAEQTQTQIVGEGILEKGKTSVEIANNKITQTSRIFITPTTMTDTPLTVVSKNQGQSFTVAVLRPEDVDVHFDWWIVNE